MGFLVLDFFRYHHNSLRDTTSWDCIVQDDCARPCLIRLQSFPLNKNDVDPTHGVLMHFPLSYKMQDVVWSDQALLDYSDSYEWDSRM